MATSLDLFPARVRIADKDGFASQEFLRALQALFVRVGGATGPSTTDLATSDDDDSGLEEFKAEFAKALQGLESAPVALPFPVLDDLTPPQSLVQADTIDAEFAAMREQIADLYTQIAALQQGTEP